MRRIRKAIAYTPDLIAGIRDIAPFEISVSAYPETPSGFAVGRTGHRRC